MKIYLNILIDALGYEIAKNIPFLDDILIFKQKTKTILGYSSSAIPSILTGENINTHGIWSYFYFSPQTSPFKPLKYFQIVPKIISEKGPFRRGLKRFIKWKNGFSGAFEIYNLPLKYISLFDLSLKKDVFKPKAFNCESIFDVLIRRKINYQIYAYPISEQKCFELLINSVKSINRDTFYFLYLPMLDALLHSYGTKSETVKERITWYAEKIKECLLVINNMKFEEIVVNVFSDHGQADVVDGIALMEIIENEPFEYLKDYVAVYDSTMARFWCFNEIVKQCFLKVLKGIQIGRILTEKEKEYYHINWKDNRYGDIIYLLNPGYVINPSYMGRYAPKGMHGYDPLHSSQDGVFFSSLTRNNINRITDIKKVILSDIK